MCPFFVFKIFNVLELTIPSYALFAIIGLLFMMLYLYRRFQVEDIQFISFLILIVFMASGVGVGSKLLFFITQIPHVLVNFSWGHMIDVFITSGFVFYGGLFGAILGVYIYSKIFKRDTRHLFYLVCPSFPLFHAFARLGCFFAGCCYGKVAKWGFPLATEPDIKRIPIQLIESVLLVLIFIIVCFFEKKYGEKYSALRVYLFLYAVARFFLEFFRGDELRGIWFGISTSQIISLGIIFCLLGRKIVNIKNK